ncbi:MAG: GspH/FimT family pseudopilin [Granulosicoccus sp.]|nr:GspH/FimT family pseudopilin [Granulosicoccus sp.]
MSIRLATSIETCRDRSRTSGFSFVELIVVLVVVSVLLGIAVPSFGSLIANTRLDNLEKSLGTTLQRAMAESKKQRKRVVVCARYDNSTCGTDWTNGWLVFVDENDTGTRFLPDSSEQVLKIEGLSDHDNIKLATTVQSKTSNSTVLTTSISLEPNARVDSATVVICDERGLDHARSFSLLSSGLVNHDLATDSLGNSLDIWGEKIECPT